MKAQERHHLKENEFAMTTGRVMDTLSGQRDRILMIGGGIVLVAALVGGYLYIQRQADNSAGSALGSAMTIANGQIVPAPTVPGATQQAGTYPTEQARNDAAVAAYQKVIAEYPNHSAGLSARYHLAGLMLSMGKAAEAAQGFAEVSAKAGSSLVGPMAKMGQAQALAAQSKFDEALAILTELSGQRDSKLPMDGVLMELARVCQKAGKTQDARAAYKRVVDEFPQSPYVQDARQQLAAIG
jgi:TolA-binding protein